jgi:LysM repeat protein
MGLGSAFSAGQRVNWGVCAVLAIHVLGCAPAYVGPGQFQQPPARLAPTPQSPLMLPPTNSTPPSTLQQVPNMPADQVFEPPKITGSARYHSVRAGETLSGIAKQYGVTVDQFMRANAWSEPPQLEPGLMILVP